ncbi:hypothetical protein [Caulobacter sp.]|uniref:hypothetical protein n=1 Tax=Caulobacter sp. TaxID=78 RepID=UPI001B2A049B|nr:hypothetical protein [Caulobacter sp.]MBO9544374.1 hypothetical protein [Caulobacter sp.]
MAMQDPAGGGRLIVVETSALASSAVVYTVADGKTFVGFLQSGSPTGNPGYKVNGIAQVLPYAYSTGVAFTPLPVIWPAGTVIAKSGSSDFYLQGNEL